MFVASDSGRPSVFDLSKMPTASELVQLNVARALKEALRDNRGSGGANQETAALRGVIDFLKSYMKTTDAKGGGAKMRGEAAALALQAIAFANKCGGVDIKFNSDGQDVKQEDEDGDSSEDEVPAAPAAAVAPPKNMFWFLLLYHNIFFVVCEMTWFTHVVFV